MLSRRWPGNVEAAGEREIHSGRSHHSHRRRGVSQGWRRVSRKDKGVIDETARSVYRDGGSEGFGGSASHPHTDYLREGLIPARSTLITGTVGLTQLFDISHYADNSNIT